MGFLSWPEDADDLIVGTMSAKKSNSPLEGEAAFFTDALISSCEKSSFIFGVLCFVAFLGADFNDIEPLADLPDFDTTLLPSYSPPTFSLYLTSHSSPYRFQSWIMSIDSL